MLVLHGGPGCAHGFDHALGSSHLVSFAHAILSLFCWFLRAGSTRVLAPSHRPQPTACRPMQATAQQTPSISATGNDVTVSSLTTNPPLIVFLSKKKFCHDHVTSMVRVLNLVSKGPTQHPGPNSQDGVAGPPGPSAPPLPPHTHPHHTTSISSSSS